MRYQYLYSCVLMLSGLLSLGACGGGGDGALGGAQRGVFLGPVVSGLEYETPTHRGITDERGGFRFESGETVTFRLGATVLGSGLGKPVMTPVDLVPGAEPPTTNQTLIDAAFRLEHIPNATLLNLLVFLQTLDADEDLENGIQIPGQVAALLRTVQIDFVRSARDFQRNAPFRQLIHAGLRAGLWGGVARPIRNVGLAIDLFYAHAGITPHFERARTISRDEDGNGTVDEVVQANFEGEFVRTRVTTRTADGVVVNSTRSEYDARGRHQLFSSDTDRDGVANLLQLTEYSAAGDRIRFSSYREDEVDVTEYVRDDQLGLLKELILDRQGDGKVDRRTTFTRDEQGLVAREEIDSDGDSTLNRIYLETYDEFGRRVLSEEDTNADGTVDIRRRVTFDDQNRELSRVSVRASDGRIIRSTVHIYDDALRAVTSRFDADGDGPKPTHTTRRVHDELGRLVLREDDVDGDGIIDERTTLTYEGNAVVELVDDGGDGVIDELSRTVLSENGNEMVYEHDDKADGVLDFRSSLTLEPCSAFFLLSED